MREPGILILGVLGQRLGKRSLGVNNFPSKAALREQIAAYIAQWNEDPTPFIWTSPRRRSMVNGWISVVPS
jgi:hypothetical protein